MAQEQLPKRAANIFVNYRRDDSAGHAGRLFDHLSGRFPGRVFMDVDTIEPGIDFAEVIEQAVGCCEVLVVVIGREWLDLKDATGRRRLDNPNDFVRMEIGAALERHIRVIPVLVEGASMPRPEDLPPDIVKLTRRNAIELSDGRWASDVDRLIQTIEGVLQQKAPSALLPAKTEPVAAPPPAPAPVPAPEKTRSLAWMIPAVLVLLALVGWGGWKLGNRPAPQDAGKDAGQTTEETTSAGSAAESPATLAALPPTEPPPQPEPEAEPQPQPETRPETRPEPETRPAAPPVHTSDNELQARETEAEEPNYRADACKKGFVWREARSGDRVCVTPESRQQVIADNRQARARRDPADPDRCLPGYVWREAFKGDHTCVPPESRDQAILDNSLADERRKGRGRRLLDKGKEMWQDRKDKG